MSRTAAQREAMRRRAEARDYRPIITPITFGAARYFSSIAARAAARLSGVSKPRFSARIIQQKPRNPSACRLRQRGHSPARPRRCAHGLRPACPRNRWSSVENRSSLTSSMVQPQIDWHTALNSRSNWSSSILLAPRRLMQPRQRAREIGDPGEGKLIEGDGGHVVLAKSDRR